MLCCGLGAGCWVLVLVWSIWILPPPLHRTPLRWTTPRRTAQNIALFFPLPPSIFALFVSLSGCLLVEFWWCFRRRGNSNGHIWTLGLWRLWGRRGFTRQPENSKRAHLRLPALETPPKFNEKTPKATQKERKWDETRQNKFWALHPSGSHFCWFGPPSGPHLIEHFTITMMSTIKFGQSRTKHKALLWNWPN